jgi:type II secretory pathway pseudopilin PulG
MRYKQKLDIGQIAESGYTIIEGLVAVLLVAFLASAIAPMIALPIGIRAQAKRVELAAQAAKSYIDAVKSDPDQFGPDIVSTTVPSTANAPSAGNALTCNAGELCTAPTGRLYCVDGDGDNQCTKDSLSDMIVQGIAYNPLSGAELEDGYCLGVRVYRADAFKESGQLGTNLPSTNITNAVINPRSPQVMMTTEVRYSNTSYTDLKNRIAQNSSSCQ